MNYFRDPDFQEKLVALVCRDLNFLRSCGHLLEPNDFKPKRNDPTELWTIATTALDYWEKYHQPIRGMLRTEMLDHSRKMRLGPRQKKRLLRMAKHLSNTKELLVAPDALQEKVIQYKKERYKSKAVHKLIDLQESGGLTDERWLQIAMEAVDTFSGYTHVPVDYVPGLEDRIVRRQELKRRKYPMLMIEPLDRRIRAISRGEIGLWMAFLKVGKSIALVHTALAHLLQGYNVLYFTLEDPLGVVEDRLDSSITAIPTKRLDEMPKKLRKRYARFIRLLRSRMKVIDATEGGLSVGRVEEIWERERGRGFSADVVIIDYDDELQPPRTHKGEGARRFEFGDIYRDLRRFAGRKQVMLWIAAQANRKAEGKKIITGAMAAEDLSKIRKVTMAIGIGVNPDWGENGLYLNVMAHKNDKDHIGFPIMADKDRALFYDPDATAKREAAEKRERKKKKRRP